MPIDPPRFQSGGPGADRSRLCYSKEVGQASACFHQKEEEMAIWKRLGGVLVVLSLIVSGLPLAGAYQGETIRIGIHTSQGHMEPDELAVFETVIGADDDASLEIAQYGTDIFDAVRNGDVDLIVTGRSTGNLMVRTGLALSSVSVLNGDAYIAALTEARGSPPMPVEPLHAVFVVGDLTPAVAELLARWEEEEIVSQREPFRPNQMPVYVYDPLGIMFYQIWERVAAEGIALDGAEILTHDDYFAIEAIITGYLVDELGYDADQVQQAATAVSESYVALDALTPDGFVPPSSQQLFNDMPGRWSVTPLVRDEMWNLRYMLTESKRFQGDMFASDALFYVTMFGDRVEEESDFDSLDEGMILSALIRVTAYVMTHRIRFPISTDLPIGEVIAREGLGATHGWAVCRVPARGGTYEIAGLCAVIEMGIQSIATAYYHTNYLNQLGLASATSSSDSLTVSAAFGAEMRSGPGNDYELIGTLAPGEQAQAEARNGDWLYIGDDRWVPSWSVTIQGGVTSSLPFRAAP
jgi:hypothetical protein